MLYILILSHILWAQEPLLEGLWSQDCLRQASRHEYFQDTQVTLTERYFRDTHCTKEALTFESLGEFNAQDGKIDFAFHKISIAVQDLHSMLDFNSRKVCGIDTWDRGVAQEVTGLYCEIYGTGLGIQVPPAGQKRYGIYKIEGDLLFFGKLSPEKDASSPEKRPIEFDGRFFRRSL